MEADNTWARAEEIYTEALNVSEAERESFVQRRCGEDPVVREEVLKLLAAQGRMGSFLEAGMLDFRGQEFGSYRALEEIGRGGMSVVYSGERVGGGFDKRVAIKVVLTQVGSAPETQILASLEHPNIARLLDGGMTSLGFRFLVMELVQGVPFTEYGGALGERDILRLFLQVCHGVQAAHGSLVVHRDLKPDNILVTADGTVKLLDFGIAKMLAPTGTQTVGPRAFTVDYASPEQILGQPASTLNDIFSLGVLLCELVGGRVPRELNGLALDEIAIRIQGGAPADLPLRGDLASIAGKAMEGEPSQRYESAGAMARDIERYLAGEPVEARPASWAYRTRLFLRRHRYGAIAASIGVVALAVTAAYAARQAQLAEMRFEQVRSLSRSVMFELHDSVRPLEGSEKARQMIADRSLKYLDALVKDPSAADGVLLDAARGYLRMAQIQGKTGEYAGKAANVAGRVAARSPGNREAQAVLADARKALAGGKAGE